MTFATEQDVRNETHLLDFDETSSEQIRECLSSAHQEILAGTILVDGDEIGPEIIRAESLLTASHLFRRIVIGEANQAQEWRAQGVQVNDSVRFANLSALSQQLWDESWMILRPFLRIFKPLSVAVTKGESE